MRGTLGRTFGACETVRSPSSASPARSGAVEIAGLDRVRDNSEEGTGWIEIEKGGALVRVSGKTGWREVETGRSSKAATCLVVALGRWLE